MARRGQNLATGPRPTLAQGIPILACVLGVAQDGRAGLLLQPRELKVGREVLASSVVPCQVRREVRGRGRQGGKDCRGELEVTNCSVLRSGGGAIQLSSYPLAVQIHHFPIGCSDHTPASTDWTGELTPISSSVSPPLTNFGLIEDLTHPHSRGG